MKKIGLLFGSFNPIHYGHIGIAQQIIKQNLVDEIWFVLSPQNPLKNKSDLLDDKLRLQILNLAINNIDKLKVSDIEFSMQKPSYTHKTLEKLSNKFPENKFALIIGTDILENFDKWKNYNQIIDNYNFIIYPRNNSEEIRTYKKMNFQQVKAPEINISSTLIRNKIRKKQDISDYLPQQAHNFILSNSLYTK